MGAAGEDAGWVGGFGADFSSRSWLLPPAAAGAAATSAAVEYVETTEAEKLSSCSSLHWNDWP